MKKKWLLLILSCAVFCELNAEQAFRRESIIFLQPNSVLEERCPSVQDLVAYIKTIESISVKRLLGNCRPTGKKIEYMAGFFS